MRNLFLFLFLSAATLVSLNAQKVGYINSQEILMLMPEVKRANSDLDVMKEMFSKKGKEMVETLQTKYQEFQRKQQTGELAPVEAERQGAELKEEEGKLGEFEQSSQDKIYTKTQELLGPIEEKVNKAIADVATENAYLYVFDLSSGAILYHNVSTDISALVKTKLGIVP